MSTPSGKARQFRSGARKKEVGLVLDMYAALVTVKPTPRKDIEIDVFAQSLEKAREHSAKRHAAQMQESCGRTGEQEGLEAARSGKEP